MLQDVYNSEDLKPFRHIHYGGGVHGKVSVKPNHWFKYRGHIYFVANIYGEFNRYTAHHYETGASMETVINCRNVSDTLSKFLDIFEKNGKHKILEEKILRYSATWYQRVTNPEDNLAILIATGIL